MNITHESVQRAIDRYTENKEAFEAALDHAAIACSSLVPVLLELLKLIDENARLTEENATLRNELKALMERS